jgi:hypothetical protein
MSAKIGTSNKSASASSSSSSSSSSSLPADMTPLHLSIKTSPTSQTPPPLASSAPSSSHHNHHHHQQQSASLSNSSIGSDAAKLTMQYNNSLQSPISLYIPGGSGVGVGGAGHAGSSFASGVIGYDSPYMRTSGTSLSAAQLVSFKSPAFGLAELMSVTGGTANNFLSSNASQQSSCIPSVGANYSTFLSSCST